MTIQNTTLRKAGPSQGNGVTTVFPFAFKVFAKSDVTVTFLTDNSELTLSLTTDYSVTLNSNQNVAPGGTVNMLWIPPSGTSITITSNVPYTQNLTLTNAGGFYPESINDALDRIVIQIQQLAEQLSRTFKIPISSIGTPGSSIGDYLAQAAASAAAAESSSVSAAAAEALATDEAAAAFASAVAAANSALAAITPTAVIVASFIDRSLLDITPVPFSSIYIAGGWDMGNLAPASPFANERTVRRVNLAADSSGSFDFGTVP